MDRIAWRCALNRVPGAGPLIQRRLLSRFGEADAVFAAPHAALRDCLAGLPGAERVAAAVKAGPDQDGVARDQRWLEGAQPPRHLLLTDDAAFPPLLGEIPDPPPLLFVAGDPAVLASPQIAVVGSRNSSVLGRVIAGEIAADLARAGVAVTSGLATGIDTAAHLGALDAGGQTLAVTGNGLDVVYPRSAQQLAERIPFAGALVSEFPIGTRPHPGHFPRRNRIISGLSLGTVVVEANHASGSLITARLAAEQGREVFAVPGSVRNPRARGCHSLIREGATLVENAQQVLEALSGQLRSLLAAAPPLQQPAAAPAPDALLERLAHEPFTLDEAVAATGLTPAALSTKLLRFELDGLIARCADGRYTRIK